MGLARFRLEVGHVPVGVAHSGSLAQAYAVDDAGMIQLVGDDGILGPSSVSNRPPFASKQELYKIASSVPRKWAIRRSSSLCSSSGAADEAY